MAYERINWQNGEVGNTPLNANNLNRMDMTLEEHDQKIGDHDYEIENLKTGAQGITEELNKKMDRINPQGSGTFSIPAVNTDNITAQTVEADEIKVTKVSSKGGTAPVAFDNDILVNGITTPIGSLASSASDKAESANERAENAYNLASRANREAASAINLANDNKAKIDLHTGLIGEGVGDKVPIPSYTDGYYIAPDGRVTQYNATATLIKIEFLDFFFRGDNIIFNHVDLLPTENCIPCAWYDISGNFISAADGLNIIAEIDEQTFKITKQYIDYCIIPVPAGASSCKLSGLANGSADIRIQTSLSDAIKELQSKPEPATLVLTNPSPLPCTDGKKILGIDVKGNSTQNGTPTPTNPIPIVDADGEVVSHTVNLFDYTMSAFKDLLVLNQGSGLSLDGDVLSVGVGYGQAYKGYYVSMSALTKLADLVGKTVTISFDAKATTSGRCALFNQTSSQTVAVTTDWTRCTVTRTLASDSLFTLYGGAMASGATSNQTVWIKNIQFELGTTATSYVPYQSNSIALPYTLKSVGTLADELIVNEDGSGKLIRRVKEVNLANLEWNWNSAFNAYACDTIADIVVPSQSVVPFILWDKGTARTYNEQATYTSGMITVFSSTYASSGKRVLCRTTSADSSSERPSGTIYYAIDTPAEISLTAEEVAAVRQLMTYKGTTIIESKMDVVSVTYSGDIKAYIDYRINQIINPTALNEVAPMNLDETEE